jgi:hypothetical protein
VLTPADYDDVIVTVAHPYSDVEATLRRWIETGPGPRPFVTITAARRSNGDPVPLEAIPLQYHNSPESRRLQRLAGSLPRLGAALQMMSRNRWATRGMRVRPVRGARQLAGSVGLHNAGRATVPPCSDGARSPIAGTAEHSCCATVLYISGLRASWPNRGWPVVKPGP